jgi:hypothetical protein
MSEDVGRSLKGPISDGNLNMELPTAAQRANSFLAFDANGVPTAVVSGSSGAPTTITRQVFSGTGSQTVFTLASDPGALGNSAQVFIGGVYQQRSTYTIAGTTLTFSQAPVAGTDNIEFVNYLTSSIGATSADLVTYTPSGVGAVARSAASKFGDVVSVKDFGAVGNGVVDDTAAIQAALDSTTASGACTTILFPAGTYKTTSVLNVPQLASLVGVGQNSILRPTSCNGLNFLASSAVGARQVSNLWIFANGGSNYRGISIDLDSTTGNRITGIVFDNVYISFFGTSVYARGLWHSTFRSCYFLNTYTALLLDGQNVSNTITDCRFARGNAAVTGTGDSRGVSIRQFSAVRPEDVQIRSTLIYGFDVNIHVQTVLYMAVSGCDLDYCQKKGLEAIQMDGGFTFRDNWIALDPGSSTAVQYGIDLPNLGTARNSNVTISNNRINRGNTTGGDYGIFVGANQVGVNVENNSIGAFTYGIYNNGANYTRINGNNIDAATSVFLFSCDGVSIKDNYFANYMYTHPTGVTNTHYGFNSGAQTTYAIGAITIPASATTATVSLASLGLNPVVVGSPSRHKAVITWNYTGALDRNNIWGSCDGTNITINVTTAFGVDAGQQFVLQVF